jgi:polygalacturonase
MSASLSRRTAFASLAAAAVILNIPSRAQSDRSTAVSILDHGASADGRQDSTAAISASIAAAKRLGVPVFVPPGQFRHRSFSLDGVTMLGTGPASALFAPDPQDGSIYLRGTGPQLRYLTATLTTTSRDTRNFVVYVDHAAHFLIQGVGVQGGNAGGIFNCGGRDGLILANHVKDTLADAIHNTNAAQNIVIAGNTVRRAGDDMIAVVSYEREPISHNILIQANDVADQDHGHGISVVGGMDVTILRNRIERTNCCAGIYLASETAYDTHSVQNIILRDNVLTDNSGRTGHGAIAFFADKGSVQDVAVEDNTIVNARHAPLTFWGSVYNVILTGNRYINPAETDISYPKVNIFCTGNTLNGQLLDAASCDPARSYVGHITGASLSFPR